MSEVIVAKRQDPKLEREIHGMFRLRHQVFGERLGWEVENHNGLEKDRFDEMDATYVLSRSGDREITGCWRLLPSTGAYMLKDVFPQLLCGEVPPQRPNVWELSRFAVTSPAGTGDLAQGGISPATRDMLKKLYEFAVKNGIDKYVTVTSVAVERLFRRAGFPMYRFGDGKAQRVGKVLSVACWIDVNDQFRAAAFGGKALPTVPRKAA